MPKYALGCPDPSTAFGSAGSSSTAPPNGSIRMFLLCPLMFDVTKSRPSLNRCIRGYRIGSPVISPTLRKHGPPVFPAVVAFGGVVAVSRIGTQWMALECVNLAVSESAQG